MANIETITSDKQKTGLLISLVLPLILSSALMSLLFVLPQPTITVNLPFKAEMFLTFALMATLVWAMRSRDETSFASNRDASLVRLVVFSVVAFILWSGASYLWGHVFDGAAHHTFVWSMYLAFFVVFSFMIRTDPANRKIASTLAIIAIFIGLLCIFDYLTLGDFTLNEGYVRIRYGKYGEMLITLTPMLWVYAIYAKKRWLQLVFALGAILSWSTAMLSLSKGVFLGGVIGFVVLFAGGLLFSSRIFRKRIAIAAAIWIVFTVGFQLFFSIASDIPSTTDYISGTNDPTRSTASFRLFSWGLARQMISDHWLIGVGADNFGVRLNDSRIQYRLTHPDYPLDEPGEDYIFERSHNEPLQIAAELGVIGIVLFALPFLIFCFYLVRSLKRKRYKLSLAFWASIAGMIGFAVNSMVSSFSFRSAQNGVAFFMIFAIGVNELSKISKSGTGAPAKFKFSGPLYAACWLSAALLGGYCALKVVAEYQVYLAEQTGDTVEAHEHFRIAKIADPEYAGLYLSNAARNNADNEPEKAAINTRRAIDFGVGMAITYSSLAKQQIAAGLMSEAEATFQEGLSVYPRSVFLRTEYTVFLEKQGRAVDAVRQLQISRDIDLGAANGWYQLVTKGSVDTYYLSQSDTSITPPAELVPQAGVYAYLDATPSAQENP